jgi:hypothetical protein
MFVQFIEGPVSDAEKFRQQLDLWVQRHAGDAAGWLGTTAGVTDDGTAFVAARFGSAEAARANSDRSEQSDWWNETEKTFGGTVVFEDHDDVELLRDGGSDDAGFVQVIRGRVNDVDAARELMLEDPDEDARPDVIGGMVGLTPEGVYTMVVYFTSEDEARAGEAQEAAENDDAFAERMYAMHDEPPRFLDITDPWFWSA